jgi:periplasmic protein TonB
LYREHNFGLSNEQLRVAGGRLPLQLVLNYPDYRVMLSAVSVQEQALADDLFRITPPADLVPAEALLEKKPDALTKGYPALYRHLQRTLKYPREARRKGTEGRVFFAFVTDEQGRISHLGKLKGIGSGCDEEAERAIRTFPGFWEPGQINGRNVKVFYLLPVVFRLN